MGFAPAAIRSKRNLYSICQLIYARFHTFFPSQLVPSPTAITTASCGFSFALPGRIMPDYVFSSASWYFKITLSPNGLNFIPVTCLSVYC